MPVHVIRVPYDAGVELIELFARLSEPAPS